jgi:RHS repeat-associated protein
MEDGSSKDWLYNDRGEVWKATHRFPNETAKPLEQFEFLYDGIGNRTTVTSGGRAQTYGVDAKNRYFNRSVPPYFALRGEAAEDARLLVNQQPVSRHGKAFWKELNFDNSVSALFAGIRIVAAKPGGGPGGTDLVAVENRTAYLAPATETFSYDADGNLTSDARRTYDWDAENRLIRVTDKPGAVAPPPTPFATPARKRVSYQYDVASRRIRKLAEQWDPSSETWQPTADVRYVHDGWNVIAELDASATAFTLRRSYAWGLDVTGTPQGAGGVGGLLFTAHHQSGGSTAVHTVCYDGNGNVTALADASTATLTASYDYDPFGSNLRITGPAAAANPYRFSTKPIDEETGLIYYGYRWYHPELGRWMSRDPMGETGGINLYGMVGNDTVNGIDLLGLEVLSLPEYQAKYDAFKADRNHYQVIYDRCGRKWFILNGGLFRELTLDSRENECCGADNFFGGSAPNWANSETVSGTSAQQDDQVPWLADALTSGAASVVANKPDLSKSSNPSGDLERQRDDAMAAGRDGLKAARAAQEFLTPGAEEVALAFWAGTFFKALAARGTGAYRDVAGHHIHAKKAFEGATGYDFRDAFSVSADVLKQHGVRHADITSAQQRLFRELSASDAPNTLTHHSRIAYQAMVEAGMPTSVAKDLVLKSQSQLIRSGVVEPTRIPWGGK